MPGKPLRTRVNKDNQRQIKVEKTLQEAGKGCQKENLGSKTERCTEKLINIQAALKQH